MRVLLVDCDSGIPNLAICRLYAYWLSVGAEISFIKLGISVYGKPKKYIIDCTEYDMAFISAIFDTTPQKVEIIKGNCKVDCGGTGYDIKKKLPPDVDKFKPDYSIYPENDTSYGFIYRGCFRTCDFCFVPEKEGDIHQEVQSVKELIQHKRIKFLDNNFLGGINHKQFLQELIELKIPCQFNQGLDIRIIDEEDVILLSKLNYIGEYIFAFDRIEDKKLIEEKLAIVKKHINKPWKIKFFLYCHPKMDIVNDVYKRILWCKENKVLPYFMRDLSCWQSEDARTYNDFSAWCNQPGLFKTHTYKEFCMKRRTKGNITYRIPSWYFNYEMAGNEEKRSE
jgi:radical SAM superfamily enzyme YgiQ (UPF0313 family)